MTSEVDIGRVIPELVRQTRGVVGIELRGSRQRGDAGRFSDWDFVVTTVDFAATAAELPDALQKLSPLAAQWDRLSDSPCFMLILPRPVKVDVIFEGLEHVHERPWNVSASTLPAIDQHFWDWVLWLASKVDAGKSDLVEAELTKMYDHLLDPLGVAPAASVPDAVDRYLPAQRRWERELGVRLPRALGDAVGSVVNLLRH